MQKVQLAKNDILFALRPSISEQNLPSAEILQSLIKSTSKKHDVKEIDVYDVNSLIDELIREVMESAFISSKIKKDYCENLTALKDHELHQGLPAAPAGTAEAAAAAGW